MTNTVTVEAFTLAINDACDARLAYEATKNAANETIKAKVNAIRKTATHATIASILIACNYDANKINESERVSNRRNVYAVQKEMNVAQFIAKVASLNHYSLAIFKTAFALESASFALTHATARAACSVDLKVTNAEQMKVVRANRYEKHIDASTASTQSSSSINALQALNVFSEARNAANEIEYRINRASHAAIEIAKQLSLNLETSI